MVVIKAYNQHSIMRKIQLFPIRFQCIYEFLKEMTTNDSIHNYVTNNFQLISPMTLIIIKKIAYLAIHIQHVHHWKLIKVKRRKVMLVIL